MRKSNNRLETGVVVEAAPVSEPQTRKSVKFSRPPKPEEYDALVEMLRPNLPAALTLWGYFLEQDELTASKNTMQATSGQLTTHPILKGA